MTLAVQCHKCGNLVEGVSQADAKQVWRSQSRLIKDARQAKTIQIKPKRIFCSSCAEHRVYFDGVHMATDGPPHVLHAFAARIGLKRRWFQNRGSYPHYDLTSEGKRILAIDHGAMRVSGRELVTILRKAGKYNSHRKERAA